MSYCSKLNGILIINAGSSSLKMVCYEANTLERLASGVIDNMLESPSIQILNEHHAVITESKIKKGNLESYIQAFQASLSQVLPMLTITAFGHRLVHGGKDFLNPVLLTESVLNALDRISNLAPLHMPHNLEAVRACQLIYNKVPHIGCFDTAFHATQPSLHRIYPLPYSLYEQGIMRYGFHGLSYQSIVENLPHYTKGGTLPEKLIVLHLGNGASACAIKEGRSVATTMGFTTIEGLMMGTRCGSIDPGLVLHIQQHLGYSLEEAHKLLYKESGLLGVSNISHDLRQVEHARTPKSELAINLFAYKAAKEAAALTISLGGLDALVFTAGIGEHSAAMRAKISAYLQHLGVLLCEKKNAIHATNVAHNSSNVEIYIIPTAEEHMIAKHVQRFNQ